MGVVVEGVGRDDGCLGGEGAIKVGYNRVEEVEWGGEGEGVRGRWGETYLRREGRGERMRKGFLKMCTDPKGISHDDKWR